MRLTPRLLLISLVTLLLPWAGCQYLREVETALREGQAAALAANATSVAGALSTADSISWPDAARFSPARTPATDVYAYRLDRTPVMDGYAEDWGLPPEYFETLQATGWRVEFLAGLREGSVYLFLRVTVDPPANRPGLSDVIRLHLTDDHGQGVDLIFSTPAPGFLTPTQVASCNFSAKEQVKPDDFDIRVVDVIDSKGAFIDATPVIRVTAITLDDGTAKDVGGLASTSEIPPANRQ